MILDEPSSGLDIQSRRELWDILLELRKTKAILITTHHMEEAEVLGDTISILSNGRLLLSGSPLELKRKVGSGYILKLCTNRNHFNEDDCLELIQSYVPSARIMVSSSRKCLHFISFQFIIIEHCAAYRLHKFTI